MVGQIYLHDNPLPKEPPKLSHVKPLVVGSWGTTPWQNFIYVHLNRVINKYDLAIPPLAMALPLPVGAVAP
ncbi:Xylulose-5-phosphate phosphoketolase [Fimbriiglobus ruber]|uniref:Xylulose-5-phosphate phosphoketolase n=1 Tax=Fimbriiglobus ruber TaxID=1908690 RepID=A0A225DEC6_9BACT|nr:Xylulose-5-phosphate phosphoketolase [Fimbriiglobus ruber]